MHSKLMTPAGERLFVQTEAQPWQAYPRPQMRRDNWLNLNGMWDFCVSNEMPKNYDRQIRVPFCPESHLSGIGEHFHEGVGLWYHRNVLLPGNFNRGRVLLHIGAADQKTDVYINGSHAGSHLGGYEAMSFDITSYLQADNEIIIRVTDDLQDHVQPYGKQRLKRGGMWYTPVSGIWQTVWLESVPEKYIHCLSIENRGTSVTIDIGDPALNGKVCISGLGEFLLVEGKVSITPENPRLWSPEDPYLYKMTIEAGEDRVESYFALRCIETKIVSDVPRLCLNGKPYFFHGLLDQGYWSDGLFTPAEPESYASDILAMKKLGFNMLRKHIKVEPEQFYYDCDRLGMVVFQDMVNNGEYSFVRDTALPTMGIQKLPDSWLHCDEKTRKAFLRGMETTVKQLKNHPCVLYWTIFNEGWGQFDADANYKLFKAYDPTRIYDTTSGWFKTSLSDVESDHIYFKPVKLRAVKGRPMVLSEFGGYSCKLEGHAFNLDKTYGYSYYNTCEEFEKALLALYRKEIIPAIEQGLCATVLTQVSDVEDETNGLLTYDRRILKVDSSCMKELAEEIYSKFNEG